MKAIALFAAMLFVAIALAQDAPKEHPQPCVIVKRHVYKFGENAARLHPHRPFDYVEGDYPPGFKWRSELGDSDVRELQKKGGKMVVLEPDYQTTDLEGARKQCGATATKSATGLSHASSVLVFNR